MARTVAASRHQHFIAPAACCNVASVSRGAYGASRAGGLTTHSSGQPGVDLAHPTVAAGCRLIQALGLMKHVLLSPALALVLVGCATAPANPDLGPAVLADAKSRSQKFCASVKDGCEFYLSPHSDGWSVRIVPITIGNDGRRYVGIDTDDMYFYNAKGGFTSALREY